MFAIDFDTRIRTISSLINRLIDDVVLDHSDHVAITSFFSSSSLSSVSDNHAPVWLPIWGGGAQKIREWKMREATMCGKPNYLYYCARNNCLLHEHMLEVFVISLTSTVSWSRLHQTWISRCFISTTLRM